MSEKKAEDNNLLQILVVGVVLIVVVGLTYFFIGGLLGEREKSSQEMEVECRADCALFNFTYWKVVDAFTDRCLCIKDGSPRNVWSTTFY